MQKPCNACKKAPSVMYCRDTSVGRCSSCHIGFHRQKNEINKTTAACYMCEKRIFYKRINQTQQILKHKRNLCANCKSYISMRKKYKGGKKHQRHLRKYLREIMPYCFFCMKDFILEDPYFSRGMHNKCYTN